MLYSLLFEKVDIELRTGRANPLLLLEAKMFLPTSTPQQEEYFHQSNLVLV